MVKVYAPHMHTLSYTHVEGTTVHSIPTLHPQQKSSLINPRFSELQLKKGNATKTYYSCTCTYIRILLVHTLCISIPSLCGLGVEKNNDDARRNYRSSNHWDAAAEMLKTEFRLEVGSKHERKHRPYVKHNLEYWFGGGIQEDRRKRQKLD